MVIYQYKCVVIKVLDLKRGGVQYNFNNYSTYILEPFYRCKYFIKMYINEYEHAVVYDIDIPVVKF